MMAFKEKGAKKWYMTVLTLEESFHYRWQFCIKHKS